MKTLILKDLPVATTELGADALSAVVGGCGWSMPSCLPAMPSYCAPSYGGPSVSLDKSATTFNASQQLGQQQNTVVNNGNNAAFVCGTTANVAPSQCGHNNINFG
ncbi:hypothetical protein SAMN06265795_104251 [Noviherbaspirillum humi]|uniref:Uncharacterized protein n=1 Tax=Noviherbaspirillum humi TaxID=1688639 RepID=A0A239G7Y6_9BURK|nr:hypothetical protein [Noviherbaspirillum humi]SNS51046.1 hypothetical protein SAMN06265795_103141 [Noviherbaspirillum humi]SNS64144.1 hypothetical protein SAMN06265795_104251 [Noviherbaspirillum humi]